MTGSGVAVAGGLAVAAGATPAEAGESTSPASGPAGTTALELVCRIRQSDVDFTGVGYLTKIAGIGVDDLFSDPAHRDEARAMYVSRRRRPAGSWRDRSTASSTRSTSRAR